MPKIDIQNDGLTIVIEISSAMGENPFAALLREECDGWHITDCQTNRGFMLGRRKSWVKALHDTLMWIEEQRDKTHG